MFVLVSAKCKWGSFFRDTIFLLWVLRYCWLGTRNSIWHVKIESGHRFGESAPLVSNDLPLPLRSLQTFATHSQLILRLTSSLSHISQLLLSPSKPPRLRFEPVLDYCTSYKWFYWLRLLCTACLMAAVATVCQRWSTTNGHTLPVQRLDKDGQHADVSGATHDSTWLGRGITAWNWTSSRRRTLPVRRACLFFYWPACT